MIVGVVAAFTVQRRAIEESGMLHEDHVGAAGCVLGTPEPGRFFRRAELHGEWGADGVDRADDGADLLVERHDDGRGKSRRGLIRGETGDGLAEASRAGVRPALRHDVHNVNGLAFVCLQHRLAGSGTGARGRFALASWRKWWGCGALGPVRSKLNA